MMVIDFIHGKPNMSLIRHSSMLTIWTLRVLVWSAVLVVVLPVIYKFAFRKEVVKRVNCVEQAASVEKATSPLTTVNKYAACISRNPPAENEKKRPSPSAPPARCDFAGTWTSPRGTTVYTYTLEANGRFLAEPGENASPYAETVTGAWAVADNALVWAYDTGPVWPPDINPFTRTSASTFSLAEVNGMRTYFTLVQREKSALCPR
jgi:hypothetical protein